MYRIALCDDELSEIKRTESLLENYRAAHPACDFTVHHFLSLDELFTGMEQLGGFDLLLLDVYFPNESGIDGAKALRLQGADFPIIFLTSSLEHAVDAFEVDAAQYLIKPVELMRFFEVLDKAFKRMDEDNHRYIALRSNGELRRVALRDILYCESHGNYQYIVVSGGIEQRVRIAMAELHMLMGNPADFVRVGVAYLVNLIHVDSVSAREMLLDNGLKINIPRGAYSSLKEQYFQFYCNRRDE